MDTNILNTSEISFDDKINSEKDEWTRYFFLAGTACVLAILSSIVLIVCLLRVKQKPAVVVVFINWSIANIFFTSIMLPNFVMSTKTYTYGEFWCLAWHYLYKSLPYTMPYLLVIVPVLVIVGTKRLWIISGPNKCRFFLIPFLMSMVIWIACFLLCIMYLSNVAYLSLGPDRGNVNVCYLATLDTEQPIIELVLMYVVPSVLLIALLTTWICLEKYKPLDDRQDKVWIIILLTFLVLYLFTQVDQIAIQRLDETNVTRRSYVVASILALSYHSLAPIGAVVIMVIFRQTLFVSHPTNQQDNAA